MKLQKVLRVCPSVPKTKVELLLVDSLKVKCTVTSEYVNKNSLRGEKGRNDRSENSKKGETRERANKLIPIWLPPLGKETNNNITQIGNFTVTCGVTCKTYGSYSMIC